MVNQWKLACRIMRNDEQRHRSVSYKVDCHGSQRQYEDRRRDEPVSASQSEDTKSGKAFKLYVISDIGKLEDKTINHYYPPKERSSTEERGL